MIVVHPILTDFDKKLILNHSVFKNLQGNVDVDELFQTIKKFVDNDKRDDYTMNCRNTLKAEIRE